MKNPKNKHKNKFMEMSRKLNRQDKTKMAVLYLLTADGRLWNCAKRHVHGGKIYLNRIRLKNGNLNAYTLLCCAKDIAYGTNHISIADLVDRDLVSPRLLKIILTAISIRRKGIVFETEN